MSNPTFRLEQFESKIVELGYVPVEMYNEVLEVNRNLEFENLQLKRQLQSQEEDKRTISQLVQANTLWAEKCREQNEKLKTLNSFDQSIEKLIQLYKEKAQ